MILILNRISFPKGTFVKNAKLRFQLKKKKKEKVKTLYLKRKKNPKAFRNYEKLFINEVSWQLRHQLRGKLFYVRRTRENLIKPYNWLKSFFKSNNKKIRNFYKIEKRISYNYLTTPFLKMIYVNKFNLATASFLIRSLHGMFIKDGKKKLAQAQIKKAFYLLMKKNKRNLYYFLFYLGYWYKLPVYYKIFSIYTKQIKIPILLEENLLKSSSIVTNWIKASVEENPQKKLYLRLAKELINFFRRDKNSRILSKEYRFNQDLRVNIIDNVQYLQLYSWEFK